MLLQDAQAAQENGRPAGTRSTRSMVHKEHLAHPASPAPAGGSAAIAGASAPAEVLLDLLEPRLHAAAELEVLVLVDGGQVPAAGVVEH